MVVGVQLIAQAIGKSNNFLDPRNSTTSLVFMSLVKIGPFTTRILTSKLPPLRGLLNWLGESQLHQELN